MTKKYELMALNTYRFITFPFFGPPTTKGWRPLLYSIQYTLLSFSFIALKSKNMFQNDLCLACLGLHYSTNTTTIAFKLL